MQNECPRIAEGKSASANSTEEIFVYEPFTVPAVDNDEFLYADVRTEASSDPSPIWSEADASPMEIDCSHTAVHTPSSAVQDSSYYAPEKHPWNAKAIASLPIAIGTVVVGIASQSIFILLAGGVVAFVLGLVSARQCRDREDRGKGFALAAMILGGAALFFSIMVLIWAA